ncbi:MAG: TlpA family protein disulfide reductase [Chloroflexi bacterium]|nr:TlpA family protein disulfide reductase [Chloroflexota bacterium]
MRISGKPLGLLVSALALLLAAGLALAPAATAAPASQEMMRPAWHTLPLADARTGQSFTLADFAGKTVYVEPMATWCTNCRQQMSAIRDHVRGQIDPRQVVFVGLSVETNLAPDALAAYVNAQGFDWTFAVMSQEMLQALAGQFGRTVTNPPAVPHFLILPDGSTTDLSTGFQSADALLAKLDEASMMHPMGAQPMTDPSMSSDSMPDKPMSDPSMGNNQMPGGAMPDKPMDQMPRP